MAATSETKRDQAPPFQAFADVRARAAGIRLDGRLSSSQRMARMWGGARPAIVERHGEAAADRILPLVGDAPVPDAFAFAEGSLPSQALAAVDDGERVLLQAEAMGASTAALKPLEDAVDQHVARFLNLATRGLPTAAEARRRAAREQENAWRR